MLVIRSARADDATSIRAVHASAFPTDGEARLVERLHSAGRATVSLVARWNGTVAGHIAFSPVSVVGPSGAVAEGLGLAPVAVLPEHQRRGIGSALVRGGLDACRRCGAGFAVVLGHPEYYPRFGFRVASDYGLGNEYGATDAFMAIELRPGAIPPGGGLVRYSSEFAELEG